MSGLKDQVPGVDFSAALEASSVSKATPGYLVTAFGRIDSTAATYDYYIQFMDSATVPADGTVITSSTAEARTVPVPGFTSVIRIPGLMNRAPFVAPATPPGESTVTVVPVASPFWRASTPRPS